VGLITWEVPSHAGRGFLEKKSGGGGWAGWAQRGEGGTAWAARTAHGGGGAAGPPWGPRGKGRERLGRPAGPRAKGGGAAGPKWGRRGEGREEKVFLFFNFR
jgi:hypothetical protein